jgi:hypothetical protein
MSIEEKAQIIEAITKRMVSPKQYTLDGESITMDSPDDLAKLIKLLQQVDSDQNGKSKGSPFRVSVCRNNSTII